MKRQCFKCNCFPGAAEVSDKCKDPVEYDARSNGVSCGTSRIWAELSPFVTASVYQRVSGTGGRVDMTGDPREAGADDVLFRVSR
eukprot:XP_001704551.1 Hypothetical protein GL50803_93049 [Giardia lamblia ATCC 50803]